MKNIYSNYQTFLERIFKMECAPSIYQYIDSHHEAILKENSPLLTHLFLNQNLDYSSKFKVIKQLNDYGYHINEKDMLFLTQKHEHFKDVFKNENHKLVKTLFSEYQDDFLNFSYGEKKDSALHLLLSRKNCEYSDFVIILDLFMDQFKHCEFKANEKGIHPLHLLASAPMSSFNKAKHLEHILLMPNIQGNINLPTKQGDTLLHLALRRQNNPDFIVVLMDKEVNLGVRNTSGVSPIDLYPSYFEQVYIDYQHLPNQLMYYQQLHEKFEKIHLELIISDNGQQKKQKI